MIAEAILRTMDNVQASSIGQSAATTTLIGCPVPTGPASHAGEHDSCYSDSEKPDQATFAVSDANAAIKTYCLKHQNDKVSIDDGILDQVPNGATSSSLILRASLDTELPCQSFPNLGQWNFFDCSRNFASAMNDCKLPCLAFEDPKIDPALIHQAIYPLRLKNTAATEQPTASPTASSPRLPEATIQAPVPST